LDLRGPTSKEREGIREKRKGREGMKKRKGRGM